MQTDFVSSNFNSPNLNIGMFDSGIGGLTVLIELANALSKSNINSNVQLNYFADTLRCPYGTKSEQQIIEYSEQIANWYLHKNINSLVMACNTSASICANKLKLTSSIPVYDLISLVGNQLSSNSKKVLVLATTATVATRAFSKNLTKINDSLIVEELACPELVPLIESTNFTNAASVISKYAQYAITRNFDTILLGCTHFPFLQASFEGLLKNSGITVINPAKGIGAKLLSTVENKSTPNYKDDQYLTNHNFYNMLANTNFYTTGSIDLFKEQVKNLLGVEPSHIQNVLISDLENLNSDVAKYGENNKIYVNDINVVPKYA